MMKSVKRDHRSRGSCASGSERKGAALAVVAGLPLALIATISTAQQEDRSAGGVLAEVVVTAQFREQNLQETPIAITAVTAEIMEQRNQTNIFQVSAQAPNVSLAPQAQANGTGLLAFIRGVGQTDFNYALEPGVGMYIDDVYYATVSGSNFDLMDLERVEVLRGPQGTLAGRNSIGGAIKLFSRKPSGDDGGSVSLTYGSYERVDARAAADITLLDDKLFARVSGLTRSRDGYMKRLDYACTHPDSVPDGFPTFNVGTGCKLGTLGGVSVSAGRAGLRWVASDSVEVNISADAVNDTSEAGPSLLYRAVQPVAANDPRWVQLAGVNYDCRFVPYGPYSCDPNRPNNPYISYATFTDPHPVTTQRPFKPATVPPVQRMNQWGLASTVDWELSDDLAIKWISSWREYDSSWAQDVDGSPLASQQLLQTLAHRQWTQELRLSGSAADERIDFTVGGFYFDQEGTLEARVDLNYAGIDFIHGPDETPATSKAAFGHAEFHATDKLSLVGGLRYTEDTKDYTYFRRNPDGTLPQPCTGFPFAPSMHPNCVLAGLFDQNASFSSSRTDWRVGINYRWTTEVMTYAQVSTGYKGGGTNPRPFFLPQIRTFKPETLTTYEVGAKSDLLNGRLRLNGAVFFNKYEDIIMTLTSCPLTPEIPPAPCLLPANVGKADVKGAELEATFFLGGGFSVDLSASMLDFEYKEVGQNTNVTLDMITPYTPEEKASVGLLWEHDLSAQGTVLARVDWSYQSEIFSEPINSDFNRLPSYGYANGRVAWRNPKWEAAVEVNNITDRVYFIASQDWSPSAGSTTYTPAMPRNWAVTLRRNF
jgi:iron complex outermembrane receptor protein